MERIPLGEADFERIVCHHCSAICGNATDHRLDAGSLSPIYKAPLAVGLEAIVEESY